MNKILEVNIPDYKLFDFHRHISNIESFDKNLKEFNIGSFCLMPSMIDNDFEDISNYINKIKPFVKKYADRAIIFGALDFIKGYEDNLEILMEQSKEINIKGIKLHPEQIFKIKKDNLEPYFKALSEILGNNIPIYIHMDWPLLEENRYAPNGKKNTFNKIVTFFPDFKYIMGHAGGSGDYLNVWKSCKKFSNVYIETSMAPVTSTLSEVVWKIGPKRLLFGSNYPYCGTSIELIKILCMYQVSDADKKAILESNWEVLFTE